MRTSKRWLAGSREPRARRRCRSRLAGCSCRISPASRCWSISPPCARPSRAAVLTSSGCSRRCPSIWSSIIRCRSITSAAPMRSASIPRWSGFGVGGIEAEAAMLGQPLYLLLPDVVGVHLHGRLREGVTATDLVLRTTQLLREARAVGKFVAFHAEGARSLPVPDRATLSNMSPEYGATIGYFPVDEQSCRYLRATGRTDDQVERIRTYFQAQGLFGIPAQGECDYTSVLDLDLASVEPAVAGPKRPQDR